MSSHEIYSTKITVKDLVQIDRSKYKFKCKYCFKRKTEPCTIYKDLTNKYYACCNTCNEYTSNIQLGKCYDCNAHFALTRAAFGNYKSVSCPKCESIDNSINIESPPHSCCTVS